MKLASSHVNSTIYKFAQLPGWTTSAPKYRSGECLRRTWMQHRRKHRVQLGLMEMPLALKAFGHKQKSWTKYNFDLIKGNYWIHLAYWTIICCSAHALPKCERNDGFKKKKKVHGETAAKTRLVIQHICSRGTEALFFILHATTTQARCEGWKASRDSVSDTHIKD